MNQTVEASSRPRSVPLVILSLTVAACVAGGLLYRRASARTNDVALASSPRPVTIVEVRASSFRPSRRYIATVRPWFEARIGPQLVSGYVDTVLFRDGATVKKGDVVATMDCRTASAKAQAVAEAARALETKQVAVAKEASRVRGMLDGGFVSENEVDRKVAESSSEEAQLLAEKAKLLGTSLEVDDCVLRAPFDGEVAERTADPGSFARPGTSIMSVVDRSTVRVAVDVPETEFGLVAPGTKVQIRLLATGLVVTAPISRRSPSADPTLRTIHVEIDLPDPKREIPVGTTADLALDVGEPVAAAEVPLTAVSIRGEKAVVFVVEDGVAKRVTAAVLGEARDHVYVDPSLAGKKIVSEGRSLLSDGDRVDAKEMPPQATSRTTSPTAKPEAMP